MLRRMMFLGNNFIEQDHSTVSHFALMDEIISRGTFLNSVLVPRDPTSVTSPWGVRSPPVVVENQFRVPPVQDPPEEEEDEYADTPPLIDVFGNLYDENDNIINAGEGTVQRGNMDTVDSDTNEGVDAESDIDMVCSDTSWGWMTELSNSR